MGVDFWPTLYKASSGRKVGPGLIFGENLALQGNHFRTVGELHAAILGNHGAKENFAFCVRFHKKPEFSILTIFSQEMFFVAILFEILNIFSVDHS